MMLDLDRFKIVNDTLGPPACDALLRQVSERIQRVVGNKGLVGRQGGDEFKILLPGRPDKIMLDHLARAIITDVSQRSEEHTSELQSLMRISYAVFCLKKKTQTKDNNKNTTKYTIHKCKMKHR